MSERQQYHVTMEPWKHGQVLCVEGVGRTQTHDDYPADTAEKMVRDLVSIVLEVPADSFDVVFDADTGRQPGCTDAGAQEAKPVPRLHHVENENEMAHPVHE